MRQFEILLYGSYGYSGKLIAAECRKHNLNIMLSGRDKGKGEAQAQLTGYPFERAGTDNTSTLRKLLEKADVLINCAGPFQHTAEKIARLCLGTGTHYTDITGEYQVFGKLAALHSKAAEAGIVIMPGVGFDVVPTDCLAVHLKSRLPSATRLQLAFAMAGGGVSRGTARTAVEGIGNGSVIRTNGTLVNIPLGEKTLEVDFGPFRRNTMCIPWGDVSTAFRSTGIGSIEVYSAMPPRVIRWSRYSKYFNWLLKQGWLKHLLLRRIDKRIAGPDAEKLQNGRCFLWGCASDDSGTKVEARLETANGYQLTARSATLIARKLLEDKNRSGYFTPAEYFGSELITAVEGTKWTLTK